VRPEALMADAGGSPLAPPRQPTPWLLTRSLPGTSPGAPRGGPPAGWHGFVGRRAARPLNATVHAPPTRTVFCFPPAGQGGWIYENWAKALAPDVAVGFGRTRNVAVRRSSTTPGARIVSTPQTGLGSACATVAPHDATSSPLSPPASPGAARRAARPRGAPAGAAARRRGRPRGRRRGGAPAGDEARGARAGTGGE
jgi:hypothetical protein